jgi:hypothetical protein
VRRELGPTEPTTGQLEGVPKRRMRDFMASNPRGRYGGVRYDLADFGLDRAERRAALRFYTGRFGVAAEG